MPSPSSSFLAQGTLLQAGNAASPEVFTTISEVRSIRGPTMTRDLIDVTNHDSAGSYREYVLGLKDGGEVTFDINYIPADGTHDASTGLLADYNNDVRRNFQMTFSDPSTTTWSFTAIVMGFEVSAAIDEVLMSSVTLKVTGQPTLA
jgi:predicted secreted protein